MSFAKTTAQILNHKKTVTRRMGWLKLRVGDLVQPVMKSMGLKRGEGVKKIGCPIRIVSISRERLSDIDRDDCVREGFLDMSPDEFVTMFCVMNDCDKNSTVTRIEFEYTN